MRYTPNLFQYTRRSTSTVQIGKLPLGGTHPIRIQSMTNTSTMDTDASVAQCKRMVAAGSEYVRLTAQGVREAANLANIKQQLRAEGYDVPLIADIHFNPKAADEAALHIEKVRINPGNYVDSVKTFANISYTQEEYEKELEKIRIKFIPFLNRCKENHTAIRVGVNHGSLSDRIMSRYGDTPAGMVESAMEFLRICVSENFSDVVLSIKASNVLIMVQTVRLLVARMAEENMRFPLHLGVTEAGDGEDGRIKSAAGIGALLIDGIGDTIRVSLSEDPECELPVARKLIELLQQRVACDSTEEMDLFEIQEYSPFDPFVYHRRETHAVGRFGHGQVPLVLAEDLNHRIDFSSAALKPDFVYVGKQVGERKDDIAQIVDFEFYKESPKSFPLFNVSNLTSLNACKSAIRFVQMSVEEIIKQPRSLFQEENRVVFLVENRRSNVVAEWRMLMHYFLRYSILSPIIFVRELSATSLDEVQLAAGMDFGPLFIDGFGDGLLLKSSPDAPFQLEVSDGISIAFAVLQSTRMRMSRTEYISCPSCGRTLFDLQQVIAAIKAKTSHLKGLKIGIMGCIVNGPGEMADADYGYVGAGKGQVSLYKKQQCIEKNIPESLALDKLIQLIKDNNDWVEPEV